MRTTITKDWSEDKEFVAELDERMVRLKQGIDKGVSMEEVKEKLRRFREERAGEQHVNGVE